MEKKTEVQEKNVKKRGGKKEKPRVELECGPAQPSLFNFKGHILEK